MRTVHRVLAVFALLFALWMGASGVLIQAMDLTAIHRGAPASDPTMQAIHVGRNGPPNFQVMGDRDYAAAALPADFDFGQALGTVLGSARASAGGAAINYVDLRVVDGRAIGEVRSETRLFSFDAATGAQLGPPGEYKQPPLATPSLRNTVKDWHRLRVLSPWGLILTTIVGIALLVMIVTGIILWWRLYKARRKLSRNNPFWRAGGWWRTLHRATAVTATLFLTLIALTGIMIASSSVGVAAKQHMKGGKRPGLTADVSSPLIDSELPGMLQRTLAAYRTDSNAAVKVVRLRRFAGMPQGVVIAGTGEGTLQRAYNATTGERASLSEPGYPDADMIYGWEYTQVAKRIHRALFLGTAGRWISLLAGLSLVYLAVSGGWMYLDLWNRRRRAGRKGFFWS